MGWKEKGRGKRVNGKGETEMERGENKGKTEDGNTIKLGRKGKREERGKG